jgi:mono/diheme cytochrome c family protein
MRCASALTLAALALGACSQDTDPGLSPLAQEGRQIYLPVCTACHNADPALDGTLGPAIAGSSRELLEAKVVRGEYPAGYAPKRDSRSMVPLPHLAERIDALTAYLAEIPEA